MTFFHYQFVLFNLYVVAVPLVQAQTISYRVNIQPLPSVLNLPATGFATIFTDVTSKSIVGYAGIVTNLEPNLLASTCNATNGCGVHIHSGKSCNSTALPVVAVSKEMGPHSGKRVQNLNIFLSARPILTFNISLER